MRTRRDCPEVEVKRGCPARRFAPTNEVERLAIVVVCGRTTVRDKHQAAPGCPWVWLTEASEMSLLQLED